MPTSRPTTAVVVEDENAPLPSLRTVLARAGVEVEVAVGLVRGLEALRRSPVDVVVLDLATELLASTERVLAVAPRTGVVVLCRRYDADETDRIVNAGAQDVIERPTVAAEEEEDVFARRVRHAALRHRAAMRTAERIERYTLAVRGAKDGLWDWKLGEDRIHFSERWKTMLGFAEDELEDSSDAWFGRIHEADVEHVTAALASHIRGEAEAFEAEYRMRHRDGGWRWVLTRGLALRDEAGEAYRIAGSQTDITARKQVEQRLIHHAFHDPTTGLPNRSLLIDRLTRAMARLEQGGSAFTLVAIELDNHRSISDSYGHQVADDWTLEVARRLEGFRGPVDTLARLSRDQFFLLLENAGDLASSLRVAERIQGTLQRPIAVGHESLFTSASIGIVTGDPSRTSSEDYLRDAGVAMNRAKALGGGQHRVFDAPMHRRLVERLTVERELRAGIGRGEFWMQYQPIVSLQSGDVAGFEALLRWSHPDRGLLGPVDFIEVAESGGLLTPIFERVFPRMVRQLESWQQRFNRPLFLNVNLSRGQFADPSLWRLLDDVLDHHRLADHTLGFEITESMMADASLVQDKLIELKERHVRLLIDDFGTGYSSLSTLKQYPIDSLKIDKSFLAGLGNVKDNAEIVRAIVNLAHNMAMDVTVEGVETEGQLKFVTNLGCEYAQGYYFSKPMPTEAAARTLVQGYRLTTIPPHSPAISQRGLGRGRVLVVEDDPVRRNQLRLALEADGFDALTAASGHQAIEVASADAPEVVLLDLELSGMTGVETCRRLKQSSETAGIPVIFLVEDDELTLDAAETLKAGAADLLSVKTPAAVLAARLDSQITVARAQNRLRRMAMTDELTGVFSRRFLFQALRRAIKAGTRRATAGLAVVLVDVDHFKRVNDTHGHIEGDRALKRIAQTIDDATRETDLVARFGGEEFVVMLQDTTLDGARTVAEKILRAVREDCDATLSIGIAHLSHEELAVDAEEDVDERITVLLRHAEAALEEAKARGRDQVVLKSAIDTSPG